MKTDLPQPVISAKVKVATGKPLTTISRELGYSQNWLAQALWRPYPKAEKVISNIIDIPVCDIWPSRFNEDGTRKDKRRAEKKKTNSITAQA